MVRWRRARGLLVMAALLLATAPARASVGGLLLGLSAGGGLLNEHGDGSEGMWDLGFWAEKVGRAGVLAPFIELRGVPWHGQQYSARLGTIIGWHGRGCALLLPTNHGDGPGTMTYTVAGRYECVRGLEVAVTTYFSERDVSPALELGFGRAGPGHFYVGASYNPVHDTWGGRFSWMLWGSRSKGLAGGLMFEGLADDDLRVPLWGGVVVGWGGGSR